jgi:murein DD-endopeptidase MepM/ murein hydrolase activator NlpD
MRVRRKWGMVGISAGWLAAFSACDTREVVEERFRDVTSHEAYTRSLRQAGLGENAVAQRWSQAATEALQRPLLVTSPFMEDGVVSPTDPRALGFRVEARRGQRLVVEVDFEGLDDGRVFVDLFRQATDTLATPFHEASNHESESVVDYPVPRTGTFLVRVQPELLYGGTYSVAIRLAPSLAFPVEGRGTSAILSRFGASREGGRRSHKGVDIFAPRGTPALAAATGRVTRVDTTRLGGNVVWLREDRSRHSLYYAHLDKPLVTEGQRVEPGDTVGLVGNTGNARTTPPHLHFGIYRRREGALDPFSFIQPLETALTVHSAPDSLFGRWVRSTTATTVRTGTRSDDPALAVLQVGTAAQVLGRSGRWLRVRLPDQSEGYALAAQVTSAVGSIGAIRKAQSTPRLAPRPSAPQMLGDAEWPAGEVVARFAGYGMLLANDGQVGWIELEDS